MSNPDLDVQKKAQNQAKLTDAPLEGQTPAGGLVQVPAEIGGRAGPEPTRYGDWEKDGKCTDF